MAINAKVVEEVNDAIRKLQKVSTQAKRESQSAFRKVAPELINAIKSRAPQSDEPHHRYSNGQIVATYYPGNLRRSFKTLVFRNSPAVFVGPKLDKGGSGGKFKGNRTDGYYAHFVEFGTESQPPRPFVRPAADATGPIVLKKAADLLKQKIESYARSISI